MRLLLIFAFGLSISCSHKDISPSPNIKLLSESDYFQTIKRNARQQQVYSGLYNAIDMTAAAVNTEVS